MTQKKFGGQTTLMLTRWDPNLPASPYNLVLLLSSELDKMIGCKVKKNRLNTNDNTNIDNNNEINSTINEIELSATTTTITSTTATISDINNDRIHIKYNDSIIDVRNGTKAHLSAEVIERINKRLDWAKELYHRGDYIHEINTIHTGNSDNIYSSKDSTVSNNKKKNQITLHLNNDVTKGIFIGSIMTTIILTVGLIVYRSSKSS